MLGTEPGKPRLTILANKELKAGMEVRMFDVLNGFENAAPHP